MTTPEQDAARLDEIRARAENGIAEADPVIEAYFEDVPWLLEQLAAFIEIARIFNDDLASGELVRAEAHEPSPSVEAIRKRIWDVMLGAGTGLKGDLLTEFEAAVRADERAAATKEIAEWKAVAELARGQAFERQGLLLARAEAAESKLAAAEAHFPPVEAGEWIRPPLDEPFLMECCDCGLVHALTFDHDDEGRIIFSAVRAEEREAKDG